jgi:hypothetical protein
MKHLKTYKVFEADAPSQPSMQKTEKFMLTIPRDIQMDLHDMSFELRDEGYIISYQWWPPYEESNKSYKDNKYPSINITKRDTFDEFGFEKISYAWIKDFCERVSSYLDEVDYNVVVKYRKVNTNDYYDINKSVPNQEPFSDHHMATSIHFRIEMISRNIYGDVNESKNYKVIPDDIYSGALKELRAEGRFDNIDHLFGFYDYWLTVGDSELPYYDPVEVKERLVSFYSSPPSSDEEWFPMFTSDDDTIEYIMYELSRLYADASFNPGPKTCHKCGVVFRQMNRHQSFCSSRCKDDYDRGMADWR